MDKKRIIVVMSFIIFFLISIVISSIYYSDKYTVIFETGTDENILTQYVKDSENINIPKDPVKEGYIFKGWMLNGKPFDCNTEINKDVVLIAKWIKEEYITVDFNTNSDLKIESLKILKGDSINKLPIPEKKGYEFIGWYLSNELYIDQIIDSNIILNAEYKSDRINTTYKKGDKVIIKGKYSNSAYSINGYHKRAIGWEREIIGIIEDGEFPYIVGNEFGVTGFFKANSIERKEM